jgi:hypothetical protein
MEFEALKGSVGVYSTTPSHSGSIGSMTSRVEHTAIPILHCPQDPGHVRPRGGLSMIFFVTGLVPFLD